MAGGMITGGGCFPSQLLLYLNLSGVRTIRANACMGNMEELSGETIFPIFEKSFLILANLMAKYQSISIIQNNVE